MRNCQRNSTHIYTSSTTPQGQAVSFASAALSKNLENKVVALMAVIGLGIVETTWTTVGLRDYRPAKITVRLTN